jgi:LVIVD repeat
LTLRGIYSKACAYGLVALLIAGCESGSQSQTETSAITERDGPSLTTQAALPAAHNMRLVGTHGLQGRSAYMPLVHAYGERRILFVGHHAGEALNPMTGHVERNGMSIVDATDPAAPELLSHMPPTGEMANGTQHVQVCDGSALPNADPDKVYAIRTNGLVGYEVVDVTDPAHPVFVTTIAETGGSSRPESERGNRETHKIQWDCESGIAYLNGTAKGWRVTRVLQVFDVGEPNSPRHIRDFGLTGWEPGATGPFPAPEIAGLHQPTVVGDRMYLGYNSGNDGVLQILDRRKFLEGDPTSADPFAPTPENLLYPQIARLDFPSFWGVHTAKPIYGVAIEDYADNRDGRTRDLLLTVSEASGFRCQGDRDVMFVLDITEEDKPLPIATFQVPEEPGDFCHRGGRFGPHSFQDAYNPAFDKSLVVLSYFNAGIRAIDIRNPFSPKEVGYFIPEVNENTTESCIVIDGRRQCDVAIQTNNVNIDDRGFIYAVDRAGTGLHIVELTGDAAALVKRAEGGEYD